MNNSLKQLYDHLPVMLQNIVLSGFSAMLDKQRYGDEYVKFQQLLLLTESNLDQQAIVAYQNEQLRKIVKHAYETVPYYRSVMSKLNLKPSDIKNQADLEKLPLLTRKDIHENFDDLRSRAFKRNQLKLGHTSGTTGTPLEILYDQGMINMTYAVLDRQYRWAGANLKRSGDRVAILRGNIIVPIQQEKPPFWRHNFFHNHLLMSAFHLSDGNIQSYIDELKKFQPRIIDGYPSTIYLLAKFLQKTDQKFPVHAVLTSSETLYDFQRELIEDVFNTHIFDYFGAAERVVFAAECDMHEGHHICSEFGITEIVGENGELLQVGNVGKMVGTSLHNMGMPMIRYLTSDMTALKKEACSCGSPLPLMEDISTKAEDIIALKDGRMISPSVLTHPFKPMHSVKASQIIQKDYDRVEIRIVPDLNYTNADSQHLIKEFKSRMGDEMDISIKLVDSLSRTSAGKFKWVISEVEKGIKMPVDENSFKKDIN